MPNTHATAAVSAVRMPHADYPVLGALLRRRRRAVSSAAPSPASCGKAAKRPADSRRIADRGLGLRAVAGPGGVGGGDPELLHGAAGWEWLRRPAHGAYPHDGSSGGLRWHGVAAAERDGDVLGVDETVDQRFPVGDPEVVPPRPGHGADGGDDLPG
jgi:hypothetical protein